MSHINVVNYNYNDFSVLLEPESWILNSFLKISVIVIIIEHYFERISTLLIFHTHTQAKCNYVYFILQRRYYTSHQIVLLRYYAERNLMAFFWLCNLRRELGVPIKLAYSRVFIETHKIRISAMIFSNIFRSFRLSCRAVCPERKGRGAFTLIT